MHQFYSLMSSERMHQTNKFGNEFDDKNTPNDWIVYIVAYVSRAYLWPFNAEAFKTAMVKTATLCMAAYEACERNNGSMAKRHFD